MSYQPVSGIVPQYSDDSNQLASGFYVKFYIANTTTPLSMATDSTGGTLLTKAKLNPDGLPISNPADNTTVFIPHVDQDYRLVIYRNEADADANNTAGAFLNVPKVEPLTGNTISTSTGTQTVAAALDKRLISQSPGDTAGSIATKSKAEFAYVETSVSALKSTPAGDLESGQTVSINGDDWIITDQAGGVPINNGLYINPIQERTPSAFLDLEDTATGESFRPALRGRLMPLSDAFRDVMNRSSTGAAPLITCYGDSNTRYYTGDTGTSGPFSKSYGAYIDLFASEYPALYQATVDIKGFPGQTAAYGLANFDETVSGASSFVVLGWGTNNVKAAGADLNAYINDIVGLFEKCFSIGAMPIMLGIPWYSSTYGSDGQLSQDRLKTWNATLYALCVECNVPFIDTYNLTRQFPSVYFNEATLLRHYSPQATKQIAQKIIDVLNVAMRSSGDRLGFTQKTWNKWQIFQNSSGLAYPESYQVGGMRFQTLRIPNGQSITVRGFGRGCVALYPRAAATATLETVEPGTANIIQSESITVTPSIDNGEYYPVQRVPIKFSNFGSYYDLTITVTSGSLYIRVLSFEDMASDTAINDQTFVELSGANIPSVGVPGREYFITEILRTVRYFDTGGGNVWLGSEGLVAVGTTAQRNDVATKCANGYKFYNTTTGQGERFDRDLGTWSVI